MFNICIPRVWSYFIGEQLTRKENRFLCNFERSARHLSFNKINIRIEGFQEITKKDIHTSWERYKLKLAEAVLSQAQTGQN